MASAHSTLAMALVELSRDRRYDENVPKNAADRQACMDLIRLNLLRRRDKLMIERKQRNHLIDQFQRVEMPHTRHSVLQLPPIPQKDAFIQKTKVSPSRTLSMQGILSSMERKRSYSSVYPTEVDTIATAVDVENGLVCRYSTGKCQHRRAQKNDGTFLNLCHMHRIRANANQRKLDRKKSMRLLAGQCQQGAKGRDSKARTPKKLLNLLHSMLQFKTSMSSDTIKMEMTS